MTQEEFNAFLQKLKALEADASNAFQKSTNEAKANDAKIRELEQKIDDASKRADENQRKLVEASKRADDQTKRGDDLQAQKNELTSQKANLEAQKADLEHKLSDMTAKSNDLEAKGNELQNQSNTYKAKSEKLDAELNEAIQKNVRLEKKVKGLQADLDAALQEKSFYVTQLSKAKNSLSTHDIIEALAQLLPQIETGLGYESPETIRKYVSMLIKQFITNTETKGITWHAYRKGDKPGTERISIQTMPTRQPELDGKVISCTSYGAEMMNSQPIYGEIIVGKYDGSAPAPASSVDDDDEEEILEDEEKEEPKPAAPAPAPAPKPAAPAPAPAPVAKPKVDDGKPFDGKVLFKDFEFTVYVKDNLKYVTFRNDLTIIAGKNEYVVAKAGKPIETETTLFQIDDVSDGKIHLIYDKRRFKIKVTPTPNLGIFLKVSPMNNILLGLGDEKNINLTSTFEK